jgi:Na+-driven multidrug efflux pump
MCVVSLANPLILGLSNIMLARAALAFKDGRYDKLRRDTFQDAVLLGMAMAVCTLVIYFVGEQLMQLLFRGNDYAGYGAVLTALALWQLAHAIGIPPSNALSALEYVRVNFYIGLSGTVLSLALFGALMMSQWGLVGAAFGLVIGSLIRSAARWVVFLRVAGEAPQSRSTTGAEVQGSPS